MTEGGPTPMTADNDWRAERVLTALNGLRADLNFLEELATKRIRLDHAGGRSAGGSAPIPLNLTACDLIDAIRDTAASLGHRVGLRFGPTITASALLRGLCREPYPRALAGMMDYEDIVCRLEELYRQAERLVDPRAPMRYIGRCPHCSIGLWIPERASLEGRRGCPSCRHRYEVRDVMDSQLARLVLGGVVDTDERIVALMRSCGFELSRRTLRTWKRRGQVSDLGRDDKGRNLYALGEVLTVFTRGELTALRRNTYYM